MWKEKNKIKKESEKIYTSNFKDLNDLEENVTVKNIKTEAKKFYMDKTKDFKKREKVFSKHGKSNDYIYHPIDSNLKKIFDIYFENDYLDKHQIVKTLDVIKNWIETLSDSRSIIDYSKNKYHPNIKSTERNYTPSDKAIERLYRFYAEKMFLEGVSEFEFDW